jgi:hypothetical protein
LWRLRKSKAGIYIAANDTIIKTTELMNESALPRGAYLTVEWEYIAASAKDFRPAKVLWLDVAGLCSDNSSVVLDKAKPVFSTMMQEPYTLDFDGELLANLGHLHDGGIHQTMYLNGWEVCDHVAGYGEQGEFITHVGTYGNEKAEGEAEEKEEEEHEHEHEHPHEHDKRQHDHEHGEGEEHEDAEHDHSTGDHVAHISSISSCPNMALKKGDRLSITSFYDVVSHPAMPGHHGGLEPVMGITILWILPKELEG